MIEIEKKHMKNTQNNTSTISDLYNYMIQVRDLLNETGQEQLIKEWKRIYARINEPYFSIAVVGEFSRGKSTLINRLLNLEILPVGVIPTTAMITRILYGTEPKLWRIYDDGERVQLPLNPDSWKNLLANNSGLDPEGSLQIELPNEWLKQKGILIIDTPGVGDLMGKRAATTVDTITSCDATLVAISATMPLSLTERAFIEQHILSRKIPQVAIVLTRLDEVAEKERSSVLNWVKEEVDNWAPQISICNPIASDDHFTCIGNESILDMISSWIENEEHILLRREQIKSQLKAITSILHTYLVTRKESMNVSREQRLLNDGKQELEFDWGNLDLELRNKENECISWLEKIIFDKKYDIVHKLQSELRHESNPKIWWEKDLPFRLRQEIMTIASEIEKSLQKKLETDISWLEDHVKKRFLSEIKLDHTNFVIKEFEPVKLNDLNILRWYLRIAVGTASILGYLLFTPFGIAVSIGGEIIVEKIFTNNIEEQKEELSKKLDVAIDRILHDALKTIKKRLQNIYSIICKELQYQKSIWYSVNLEALIKESKYDIEKVDYQIKKADELISKLITL